MKSLVLGKIALYGNARAKTTRRTIFDALSEAPRIGDQMFNVILLVARFYIHNITTRESLSSAKLSDSCPTLIRNSVAVVIRSRH